MDQCDVLIVGGGPAGSTCARYLRKHGIDVVVLDRAQFPRDKVCTGWITPAIIASLELDTDDFARQNVLQPFTGFITGMIGRPAIRTDYQRPVSYGIRRCEFDNYLLRRAGAPLRLGESLKSLHTDGDRWIANDAISARLVIGAGGHFCPVSKLVAQRDDATDDPVVLAQEAEFLIPEELRATFPVSGEFPELYFCPDLSGYGWIVRKGDYLNIGLGREHERNLSSHVDDFVKFLRDTGRLTMEIPHAFKGHAYRLRRFAPPINVPRGVMLIGDAIGLAYPQSGEGIRPSIESGLLAGELIVQAKGDYSGPLMQRLEERCMSRFGDGAKRGGWSDRISPRLRQWAAARLMQSRWFHRHVLLDRWFLHAQQPALVV